MKEGFKGALLDLDRRSRESVPSRRARMSRDWISLAGRLGQAAEEADGDWDEDEDRRPWLRPLPLWLAALRAGGLPLWRAAERRRRRLFHEPVRLARFLAIGYTMAPAGLLDELAWLRALGVRQVVVPLDQDASELQQVKFLGAIQNLRSEDCRVAAVLRPRRGAAEAADAWDQFCHWILSQAGWQLERVQLGDDLSGHVRARRSAAASAGLFGRVARLRHDYPGVALLPPSIERPDMFGPLQALLKLAPDDCHWDGLALRAPAWQAFESVGRDGDFLQRLALADAVMLQPGFAGGRAEVHFPPPPAGCDDAAAERVAGSLVRRAVLALGSGVAERVVIGMDPAMDMAQRRVLSDAVRELAEQLEGARFVRRVRAGDAGRDFVLEFARAPRPPLLVGWTDGEPRVVDVPFRIDAAHDFLRRNIPMLPHPRVRLTRNMVYFVGGGVT